MGPVIEDINKVIIRIGKDEGYDYILDAAPDQGILFANEEYDISDHILEELQKGTSSK